MNGRQRIHLVLFLGLLSPGIHAQQFEPKSPLSEQIEAPVTLNGQRPSLMLQSETPLGSYVSGGLAVVSTFTDNALLTTRNEVNDFSYFLQPNLNFQHSTPLAEWNLSLGSSFAVHEQVSKENQAAENLKASLKYKLARYLTLRAETSFKNTTGLFSGTSLTTFENIGLVERPNTSVLIPLTQRTVGTSDLLELNYQFSPQGVAGVRGTFSILDFPGSPKNTQFGPLYNTRTYSGELFMNHRVSPRQWVGVTLRRQSFAIQDFSATKAESLLLFYALGLHRGLTLSFFVGPERFAAPRLSAAGPTVRSVQEHGWTAAEGGTFSWQGVHSSIAATFARQITDGGGLFSAVTDETADIHFRRQLTSHQQLSFGLSYSQNNPLEPPQFSRQGLSASFQFEQRLTGNLVAHFGYSRYRQDYLNGLGVATANLVWLSVSYDFSRPLGR